MRLFDHTDEEVVDLMHKHQGDSVYGSFQKLTELLGDELKAARALREENRWVTEHDIPYGGIEFGSWTRNWLIENGREWNQNNLAAATEAYKEAHP